MRYEILDGNTVINTIIADAEFMNAQYPNGNYREVILPKPSPLPQPLTRLQFEIHVQTAAGLSDAAFFAALQDAALVLFWHRLTIDVQVERDNDLTQSGLSAMVSAGHLSASQVDAINQTWPTKPE